MNVTNPEINNALWYLLLIDGTRIHTKMVVAIIEASEKDNTLYTNWNWLSDISYITIASKVGVTS
jgi:hypothetical protein